MLQNILPPRLKRVLTKRPPGFGKAWFKRILILIGFICALLVIGHLGVRYVLWPQIEKSKASVEKIIGARIGAEVSIDKLQVAWTGLWPNFEIEGLRFNSTDKSKPLLLINKIYGELSWKSFYHLAPYFRDLHFEGAEIYAQRNSNGAISIAGISIDSNSNDYSAENWLFSQSSIDVNNAKLFWDDQKNKRPITSVDIVNLSLDNGIRNHEGSIRLNTPWANGPAEIKVSFVPHLAGQAGNWRDWIGTVSWKLTDLDLKKISQQFSINLTTLEGILSSNGQLKIDNGHPDGGEFYVAADQLIIQTSKDTDAIALGRLETNLSQETNDGLLSISTKTFAWSELGSPKTAALEHLSPMTFRWRSPGADGEIKEFGFSSPKISVEDVALFAQNLPLSKKVHGWIKASKADGELEDVDIHWSESKSPLSALNIPGGWFKSNKLDFSISAKLINLSFIGIKSSIPSVSNLSGFISGNQSEGSFSLNSNNLQLEINDFLEDPKISLDRAKGQISWSKERGKWVINAKSLALSNPDINTTLKLNYIIGDANKPDFMVLDIDFPKANLVSAYRYLPVGMDKEARTYLSKAFTTGTIENGQLHIQGDPNGVPFSAPNSGQFTLNLPIVGASFTPMPLLPTNQGTWSTFTNVYGVITMQNAKLDADIEKGNYKQVTLSNFHADIPSVSAKQMLLNVSGVAQGEAPQMLEYVFASPIGKKKDNLEKNLQITGPTKLLLGLKIPLSGNEDNKVDVKIDFPGNHLQWGNTPPFDNLKGRVRITETNPEFEDVTANFMGGAFKISSAPEAKNNNIFNISGDIAASFLKSYLAKDADLKLASVLQSMSGSASYEGAVSFTKGNSETNLKFDLRNWASTAPAPLNKPMGMPLTGQLTLKDYADEKVNVNRFSWSGKVGDLYSFEGELGNDSKLRHAAGIGAPAILPPEGFQLNLNSSELNLDIWNDFTDNQSKKNVSVKAEIANPGNILITGQVKKLTLLDRVWPDVNLSANNKSGPWNFRLNSPLVAGQVQFQDANKANPSGFIGGHLTRLLIPEIEKIDSEKTTPKKKGQLNTVALSPNSIPSMDIIIDEFSWSRAQLGQVKLKSKTSDNIFKVELLQTNNPQAFTTASGQWNGGNKNEVDHTTLKVDIDIKDAGHLIAHWSPQKSVEGGQGKLSATVEWDGSPYQPNYDTLSGKVNLNLEKGRLLEVNSSGAKILDVLSLQSLFRFATMDIQGGLGNIVTKGTPFKSIDSSFDISNGIADTTQFTMNLDQARVAMNGKINIPKQTQDLRIAIYPSIDATAGSLAAFAINPIVGLGVLVGQYLVSGQINRSLQSDYLVQGSWENPEVIALDQKGQPIDEKILESIRNKELLKEQNRPDVPRSQNTAPLNNRGAPINTSN